MSRTALLLVVAVAALGCTGLNAAFEEAQDTDVTTDSAATSPGSTADSTLGSAEGSFSTTTEDTTTGDPTDPPLTTESPTAEGTSGDAACLNVYENQDACELDDNTSCAQGRCRPYGPEGALEGVGCVEQGPVAAPREVGDPCNHHCEGEIGRDNCPLGSICDPVSDVPRCLPPCRPDGESSCMADDSCFEYPAGPDTFGLCRPGCNPLSDSCNDSSRCLPAMEGFECQMAGGEIDEGSACELINGCDAGLFCVPPNAGNCGGGLGCCRAFCLLGGDDCPNDATCLDFNLDFGVGICAPAM